MKFPRWFRKPEFQKKEIEEPSETSKEEKNERELANVIAGAREISRLNKEILFYLLKKEQQLITRNREKEQT